MKYSIKGSIVVTDSTSLINLFNTFHLWRLDPKQSESSFSFEIQLNTAQEKTHLFEQLKTYVDLYGGHINWHECTHDEPTHTPCVIVESYGEVVR